MSFDVPANPPADNPPNDVNPEPVVSPATPNPPAIPPETEFVDRARLGYTGGGAPPHDYESDDNHGMGFVNPPPHMQERALTQAEMDELLANRADMVNVPATGNPADAGSRPVYSPSNIPGTPETAQENVLAEGEDLNATEAGQ